MTLDVRSARPSLDSARSFPTRGGPRWLTCDAARFFFFDKRRNNRQRACYDRQSFVAERVTCSVKGSVPRNKGPLIMGSITQVGPTIVPVILLSADIIVGYGFIGTQG